MFSDIFNLLPTSRIFFVSFCFWFYECIVFAFSSSRIGQVELWRVNPCQRADRAPPLATQQIYRVSGLLGGPAVTNKHWFYFSISIAVLQAAVLTAHKQSLFSGGYNSTIKIPEYALVWNLVYRVPGPRMTVVYFQI